MESPQWSTRTRLPPLTRHPTTLSPGPQNGGVRSPAGRELRRLLTQVQPSSARCTPGNMSALTTALVQFLSGSDCSRSWWLELLDVLGLLHPFRDALASERGLLLPSVERLNQKYERQRHFLNDLDVPGALCTAFPPDTSELYRLPRDLEKRYRVQQSPIHVHELAYYVGDVGAELAAMESMWQCGHKGVPRALRTELPVIVHPDTHPRTHSSRAPDDLCQEVKPEKSVGATGYQLTGYEAAELLVQCRHLGKVIFLYLNRTCTVHSCIYDLRVAPNSRLHPEHFVFSPFGILHVDPVSGSEVQELGVWHREAVLCRTLRKIPYYRDFLKRRTFTRWQRSVRRICFLRRTDLLSRRLLMNVPHYMAALHHINRFLEEMALLLWFPVHVQNPISIDQLENDQHHMRSTAKGHVIRLLTLTSQVLEMVRQDTYLMVQSSQKDEGSTRGRRQLLGSWLHRLGSLSSLVQHMICEKLTSILQENVVSFVSGLVQMVPLTGRPYLLVSLEFGPDGDLRLCPPACQIHRSLEGMLGTVLDAVLQTLTTLFQMEASVLGPPLPPICGGQNLRQVVSAAALPPGECKEMPKLGELKIEGHQQRAHYLPLNFQYLTHMLHMGGSIQEAQEKLQRLLKDSLLEVRAFCEEHSWLSDIYLYVQSWSPHILENLRGRSTQDYEDLILKLQQWERQVHGLKDYVTTAMMEVNCEFLHTLTGPGLAIILQDILVLLTSEVDDKSHSLIFDLSQALEIFRGVSTEISSFSKGAHKVAECKMKKHELEERVEHVRSLQVVIRTNYRQQTTKEQEISSKLTETWAMYQHFLKTSSEFLSSHLPSMSGSLEQSFQACYKEAEDLIVATSSSHFRDPNQNVAIILSNLGTLLHKLCFSLCRLRDFSQSRQILQGKSFDFAVISLGEQMIQAQQDSWKLLTRCREHIAAWKLKPFMKVKMEQVGEKLQQWENSLQDLLLILPNEDPVLQVIKGKLQDFSQHLPLLQALQDPAVKHKHWVTIFAVMGNVSGGPETLTLKELLSYPLHREQEDIQKVLLGARAEFSILQEFQKIQTFWRQRNFRLVRFFLCDSREDPAPDASKRPMSGKFRDRAKGHSSRDSGTFLLTDWRSLCSLIDDSLLSLQAIRNSPYSALQQDEISEWIQKLNSLGHVLDLWVTFQRLWVFLTRVQHELETSMLQLEAVSGFQSVDRSYRSFLEVTLLDPLVLSILTPSQRREWQFYGDSLCSALQRGIIVMEEMMEMTGAVLSISRLDFPRLFFLSDQDVVDVLAASSDLLDRLNSALLCFPQFTDVIFCPESTESSPFPLIGNHATVAVIGKYGKVLNLTAPITWNPRTVSWLIELEHRVGESLKEELTACLSEGRQSGLHRAIDYEDLRRWTLHGRSYHLQCLIVTEEVVWCEDMEKMILTEKRSQLRDQQNMKVDILAQMLRQGNRTRSEYPSLHQEQTFISAWISLAVLQRDRTSFLLDSGMQTLDSFSWAKLMKYRAPTLSDAQGDVSETQPRANTEDSVVPASPLCVVDVLGLLLPYEYEYVGLDMKVMDTAVSDRTSLGVILALEYYQCGAVIGYDEGLRTQTLLSLGSALGRQVVVLKCWAGLNIDRLMLHLQGALQAGAWLVLDNAHKLKCHVLASLGQTLDNIQMSCQALIKEEGHLGHIGQRVERPGHIQMEDRPWSVMRGYGCFMTLPHIDSSLALPGSLHLLLRPISFCPPDLQNVAELALLSAGFQEHLVLAKKLSCFLRLAQESGTVTAASALPLLNSIVQKAIVSLRSDGESTRVAGDLGYQRSPPDLDSDGTTWSAGVQEESSVMSALLASAHWSRHLMDVLELVFPMSVSSLPCSQTTAELSHAVQLHLHESGLEGHAELSHSITRLYRAIQQSPGVLLTGPSGSGKTTCWKVLQQALNHVTASEAATSATVNTAFGPSYQSVHCVHLFPNSLSPAEFLGGATGQDGVISRILHRSESAAQKWVILDGAAALEWVEPISCLFGPQPVLTLASGQRLHLSDRIRLIFEMTDTAALTPALSSLCSIVHCEGKETWRAILMASLSSMCMRHGVTRNTRHKLRSLSDYLIPRTLCFLEEHGASVLSPHHSAHRVHHVSSFCSILQALLDQHLHRDNSHRLPEQAEPLADDEDPRGTSGSEGGALSTKEALTLPDNDQSVQSDNHQRAQTSFLYALIWAFGGHLNLRLRDEFDGFLRKSLGQCVLQAEIPPDTSIFELIPASDGLTLTVIPGTGRPQSEGLLYAARSIVQSGRPLLLVGAPGSGKTTLAQSLVPPGAKSIRIPVNSLLQATHLRQILKTQHDAPHTIELTRARALRGRRLFLLDDLHEAQADPNNWTQPTLEVVRHIVSDGDSGPQCCFLATTSPPGDGFRSLCPRISRLFCVLVMTPSGAEAFLSLFSLRFMVWLKKSVSFQQPKEFSEALAAASVCLYHQVTKAFPSKYCFSLHHLHRLIQSMTFLCPSLGPNVDHTRCGIVRLWLHEALRTFGDDLETYEERSIFRDLLRGCAIRTFSRQHTLDSSADITGMVDPVSGDEDRESQLQPKSTNMETDLIINEDVRAQPDINSCDITKSPRKSLLPLELLRSEDNLQDLSFFHDYSHGVQVRSDSYRERPSNALSSMQTDHQLTLSPEDCHHLAHLTRVLRIPRGHILLLSKHPGSGRRSLARLAAQLTQCTLLELSGKETTEERHSVIREACRRAAVHGSSAAILSEGTSQSAQKELEALIREGTFPGLYSTEQEETILQDMLHVNGKGSNKKASNKSLRERYNTQVCSNFHVIFLQKIRAVPPPLQRLTFTDVYHPWSLPSLQRVSEKVLEHYQIRGSSASSISRMMSFIHLLAQDYCHRQWPRLPLTSPKAFISFIHIYMKISSELQKTIGKEEERLRHAMYRVQQVSNVQDECTEKMEECWRQLQEAEKKTKHCRKELEMIEEDERRVQLECEELDRAKERVRARLNRLRSQRESDLDLACLQWAAVQKELRILDVEEIRSYRIPPAPVVMVTDVLCTVFRREQGWENAKLLIGKDNFYQDLQFYDGYKMADCIFASLTRAVNRPEFNVHHVQPVSTAAASLCQWLVGLQRYCGNLRTLDRGRALLLQLEAEDLQAAERMAAQRLLQEKLKMRKTQSTKDLQAAQDTERDLQKDLQQITSKRAVAQECQSRAQPHLTTWTAALKAAQHRLQSLQTDALLVSASISYLGCLPWTRCTRLLAKWWSVCEGHDVSVGSDDIIDSLESPNQDQGVAEHLLQLLSSPSERLLWQKERLPKNTETVTRAALLRASGCYSMLRPTLILDPDLMVDRWMPVLLDVGDQAGGKSSTTHEYGDHQRHPDMDQKLCVIDASDIEFIQRLSSATERGLCVLIKNVEKAPFCLEIISRQRNQLHPVSFLKSQEPLFSASDVTMQNPSLPPVIPDEETPKPLQLFLSTSLPLSTFMNVVEASFLKDVTMIDLSLGSSGLEQELVQKIMLLKDPRLQEEKWSLIWSALKMKKKLHSAEDKLLDYVSSGTSPLVEDKGFLKEVSLCEEVQATLRPSLLDVEGFQHRIEEHMIPYVSAARPCVHLYSKLQEISRLSPHYHFPASSVLDWAHHALYAQAGSGQEIEKVLTRGILTLVLPMIAEEHRPVLHVLLAVGKPHPLEWFSFLGLAWKSLPEPPASCIQRPQWVDVQSWGELAHLEKLSAFQGIRSSLSAQTKQWREYFTLRSTVIGPIPCSTFSHLTLFQVAILWRILKPEYLGLVLSHLTSCVLGPEPEDKCVEEDVISRSDPRTPLLFLHLPGSLDLPINYILHMAKKKGKKVTMIWSENPPAATRESLLQGQREGQWLLLNLLSGLDDLLKPRGEVTPDFRLCICVEEDTQCSLQGALQLGSRSTPCALRLTLRDVLLLSCLDVAEYVGEQDPLTLKFLILHSILLLRQEYGVYVQRQTYCWGQKDLRNALCTARAVMACCQDWDEALPFITGAIIYGGHIVEEEDVQSVMAVIQHCLQGSHQPRSRGLSHVMSALTAAGISGPWIPGVTRSLQKLLSMRDPAALGLSEGLKTVTTKMYGHKVLCDLLSTQDVWTSCPDVDKNHGGHSRCFSSECGYTPSKLVHETVSECLTLLMELEYETERLQREMDARGVSLGGQQGPKLNQIHSSIAKAETMTTKWPIETDKNPSAAVDTDEPRAGQTNPRPLICFLLGEWKLLHTLFRAATREVTAAVSSCYCWRCQELRKALCEGHVPMWWNVYSSTSPVSLQTWIKGLHLRLKLLSTYISQPSPLNVSYNMSVFQHPHHLLHSLLQEQALEDHRELERYHLRVQVSGRTSPSLQPVGVSLVGIHLRHALWDTRLNLLQETLSPQLCALPVVHVSAAPGTSDDEHGSPTQYLCPLYTQWSHESHKQHQERPLLFLPLPTNVSSCVWSQRRVHAVSFL
ncbi:dynein heavy chain domain-containing protein 1 [Ranitomeya imitator]|uniref:dynein heavy chain domain-containing protein 1 n=1 Tax=Ranitomeya imitator TaxID=111125 RepID=UPI0037E8631F